MSRVFLATERAFSRSVVIKVLPADMAGQLSIERFKREIAIAARLQHAHIVPLMAAGEVAGLPWFSMPFLDGESLRDRIAREGELPLPDAIRILREIASALAYAHSHHVVHRDIKPENVMLAGGTATVTDFGVAKAVSSSTASGDSGITGLGITLGTPAYMSPEQVSADPALDYRTDIYAWGVVAYELLTGQVPFAARSVPALLAAQVTEAPEQIQRRRPSLPPALAAMVMRCLEKRPADRVQTADELVRSLDASATRESVRPRRAIVVATIGVALTLGAGAAYWSMHRAAASDVNASAIAVLSFENVGGDTTFDYLAEGLSDEIRSALTEEGGISVKARASSLTFRGSGINLKDVGSKLGVNTVLEGTVRRTGGRLRVTAELARVSDGVALWSHSFDEDFTSLVRVRDSITHAVERVLPRTGGADVRAHHGALVTKDFEAYNLLLKADYHRKRFEFVQAIGLLKQSLSRDTTSARAYASLALAYAELPLSGFGNLDSVLTLARQSASRARALDPALTAAQIAEARILALEFRFAASDSVLRRVIGENPDDEEAHQALAITLASRGLLDDALAELAIVNRLDPLSVRALILRQYILLSMRRFREVVDLSKSVFDLDAKSAFGFGKLTLAYAFLDRPDSAVAAAERGLAVETDFGSRAIAMFAYAAAGKWDDAEKQRALAAKEGGNSPNFNSALNGLIFGEWDSALAATERGVRAHEPLFGTIFLPCDPMFDPLKSKPRFVQLIKEIGGTMCVPVERWPIAATHRPAPARGN